MQYQSRSENYASSLRDSPTKWSGVKQSKNYAYKTASYQYSTPGSGSMMTGSNASQTYLDKSADKNIDQLDALLEDLKTERHVTRDRDHSLNYRTIERSTNEDPLSGTVTRTTRIVRTSNQHPTYDDVDFVPNTTTDYSTIRSNSSIKRNDYQAIDKTYPSNKLSPGGFYEAKKTHLYESNRSLNRPNMDVIPMGGTTTISTTSPTRDVQLEKDLQNIALTDDILPVPGTKVTTTVRTYTYEIPANAPSNTTNTLTRKNLIYNASDTNNIVQPHPHHAIPPTVVYNTESYATLRKDQDRPIVTHQSYELRDHYETKSMRSSNGLPPSGGGPAPISPRGHGQPLPPPGTTVVYNTTTTTNRSNYPPSPQYGVGPHSPVHGGPGSPHNTTPHYIYKETTNTVNTIPGPGSPTHEPLIIPKQAPQPSQPLSRSLPPNDHGSYPPGSNVTYKYTTTTTNTRRGPDYGGPPSPSLPPAPFPLDGGDFPINNANPPQRVEDLMQTFGNADAVDKSELSTPRKREIETAVASPNQQIIPSVNRPGKEVYYPPGHDMMLTKREQMSASSGGGGRWAKGSGRYEYESGYKSKTKTKAGGAMVPVCLPLCCAMPCTIM